MKYLAGVVSLRLDEEKCTGCGRCTEVCPRGVLVLTGAKASITDRDLCIECGACAGNCAFGALSVNAGVGCAAALINAMITGGEPNCCCGGEGDDGTKDCC